MAAVSARLGAKRLSSLQEKEVTSARSAPVSEVKKGKLEDHKCNFAFFDIPCEELAKKLLGHVLVRASNQTVFKGLIVETEAYLGPMDKAAHSYKGKRTPRNEAMFMPPGTSYVYSIYGMYHCFNISSRGDGAAVLIRALEPIQGVEEMKKTRALGSKKKASDPSTFPVKDLCNGPSKLCSAFEITKDLNELDMTTSNLLWLEPPVELDRSKAAMGKEVIACSRIGVDYAEEWVEKDLRFYQQGNPCVSKRDRAKERLLPAQPQS